jgi:hypothetical protein
MKTRYGRTKSPCKNILPKYKKWAHIQKSTQAHTVLLFLLLRLFFCLFRFAGDNGARQSGSDDEQLRMPSTMTEQTKVTT